MRGHRRSPSPEEIANLSTLFKQGHIAEAEILSKSLTTRFQNHGFAWKVLGAVYLGQNRYEDSVQATLHAVTLLPNDAATYNNLGTALIKLKRLDEAEANFRKALAIAPDYAKALNNLGALLRMQCKLPEAEICCRQALDIDPNYASAHARLGNLLELQDRPVEASSCYRAALALTPDDVATHTELLHLLSHDVAIEPRQLFAEHLAFGEQFEPPLHAHWQSHSNVKDPARRLQVGFVSGDLYDHALSNFLEPLFKFLAKKPALSLHVYDTHTLEDAVTLRMHGYFAHWHTVANLSDAAIAEKIRTDGIDILIDLCGHTARNRLLTFARKPAPIQASWLGYLGTTGLQAMDYYLCDRFWIPPGELDWQFTEKPVYLPAAVVFQPSADAPPINDLPALKNGYITFGSFNRTNKINDSVIALWSMLMHQIPTARMVLGAIPLGSQDAMIKRFAHEGIEQNRLAFYPRSSTLGYLTLHHLVDFCLDTFPHGGGATTAHAVWMGVPTLSLAGESPQSRFGATLMHHLGLGGFIATSINEFISQGCYWAEHIEELASIRLEMRVRFKASPLGQPELFATNFEIALRAMWWHWCSNSPPCLLDVQTPHGSNQTWANQEQLEPSQDELDNLAKLFSQKRFSEAESISRALVNRFPEHGYAWKILGSVLFSLGRLDESLSVQKKTVELRPDDHEAHFNLAYGFHEQGYLDEAVKSYFLSLGIRPNNAVAYCNLGNLLKTMGFLPDAEAYCREAIDLSPEMANAHNNLGNVLHAQGKFAQALASYRVALTLKPDWAAAYNNLAITLKDQGDWSEAEACYRKALAIAPDWAAAHSNLLYCLSHDVQVEPRELFTEHLAFGEQFETPLIACWQSHSNNKDPTRRLQIGFVSGDLYDHALANFIEPLFKFLAHKQGLSLHVYYTHTLEDAVTRRMHDYFAHWHAVANLSEAELAEKIRADGIDILIDLCGHTAHNRLLTFARKPAPIQASWLGYLGTTGLHAMDYYLCDQFWIPPGQLEWQFTEKPAFLPAAVVFQPNEASPPINALPALKNGYITFGSFNRTNKLNGAVIALWSMLLHSIPTARMVLGAIPLDSQDALTQLFTHEGIEISRLAFYPRSKLPEYLTLHHQVDFCLDTFPYGGGATTAHAAWMGVPTLSLAGESPSSRFGATIMHTLDLDGFIATSIDDFIVKGRYWAEHTDELATIRREMRARFNACPLGQPERFATDFETTLRTMWQHWCKDLPTAIIEAEPLQQDLETLALLFNQQRYSEAESFASSLVVHFPGHVHAWRILGAVYQAQKRYDASLQATGQAIALAPDDASGYNNLGMSLLMLDRLGEAEDNFRKAIAVEPDYGKAFINLGTLLRLQGHLQEAETCSRRALAIDPCDPCAHINLGNTLEAQGHTSHAQASYYRADMALDARRSVAHSNVLYLLSHDVLVEPQHLFTEHQAFGEQFEAPLRAGWQVHSNAKDPARCLQIGFVSGDFCEHALTNFQEPLLKFLACKQNLSLHAYDSSTHEDAVTRRLRTYFSHWHPIASLSDVALADKIRIDEIDILIDLSGHTARNRLLAFALKPAPIQASWLGYLGTTGLQAMDYYLCDQFWLPPGELDWQFSEKLAYLPAAVTFQPSEHAPPVNQLPALENGYITFGSFNRHNKINDSVIALWSALLHSIPTARMALGAIPAERQEGLIQTFAQAGVAQNRLLFYPRTGIHDYLALHHQIDFCLDTFPHGGGATTAHAAWMGVPTLSLAGESPASRLGATEMHILDLDRFIATSIEDFVAKGCYWAEHLKELATIRSEMRARFKTSALGQPERFATHFEAALRAMWQRWCSDLPPVVINATECKVFT
jgi:predicted O-linked N-acetylglucosamine transferase (SPINDLY family)